MANEKPDSTSSAYDAMASYWNKVDTILGGADAMRASGEKYLPKFPMETQADYDRRKATAKFTNIFSDIVEGLAAKPFTEEVTLKDGSASDAVKTLIEDIDGKGNHINVFAQSTFFSGIAQAISWILIDYTKNVPPQATIAEERKLGARPWWVHIPPTRLLAVYSDIVGGVEVITHARILEPSLERSGYAEIKKRRVRVFNREPVLNKDGEVIQYLPATWELLEEQSASAEAQNQWISVGTGPITIGIIPLVPFTTGRRLGSAWQLIPSMRDAADLQITLYQQENALEHIKECAGFPMVSANGVSAPTTPDGKPMPLTIGPKAVLYAPASDQGSPGSWSFIEPSATSMKFLSDDIDKTKQDLRELGRQPLTAQTGNLTVVTTAFAAQKGNSAIQAWALNLKDALEHALAVTCMWLKDASEPEVQIDTDFDVGMNDDKDRDTLVKMRAAGDLSQKTLWREMQRRAVLSPDFNADDEEQAIIHEMPSDMNTLDPVTGEPIEIPQSTPKGQKAAA